MHQAYIQNQVADTANSAAPAILDSGIPRSSVAPAAATNSSGTAATTGGQLRAGGAQGVLQSVGRGMGLGSLSGHPPPPPLRHTTTGQNPAVMTCQDSGSFSSDTPVRLLHGAPAYYDCGRVLGNGSFGVVCEARSIESGEKVAIKKVLQDPRYKNRELDVMKELNHPNVVTLKDFFYTEAPAGSNNNHNSTQGHETRESQQQRFLNVVMDYLPETVYRVMKTYTRLDQPLPLLLVRLYMYQMCRGLGYLHSLGICHRDIKPQNLLVDSRTHVLKLCDFGSAKRLLPGEPSVSYICSRFYRAPELMLGATEYTTAIDIWSIGCVFGELLMGKPLFAGDTSVDQLVKIIQVLGTPTSQQMQSMSPNYTDFKFPPVRSRDWRSVLASSIGAGEHVTDDALDLLSQLLRYEPSERLTPYETLAHPFFEPLRDPCCRLPEGTPFPTSIFDFSEHEMQFMSEKTRATLIRTWRNPNNNNNNNHNSHNQKNHPNQYQLTSVQRQQDGLNHHRSIATSNSVDFHQPRQPAAFFNHQLMDPISATLNIEDRQVGRNNAFSSGLRPAPMRTHYRSTNPSSMLQQQQHSNQQIFWH